MPRRLVVASRNRDKIREIRNKLVDNNLEILSLADFDYVSEVREDQPDLLRNAIKKAAEIGEVVHEWTLADDTGLEVDALKGAPGVFSARYSGPGSTYESNCRKLLKELEGVAEEERTARFRTVVCLKTHSGLYCVEGIVEGRIGFEEKGSEGFGYDPVFVLPDGRTLAECTLEEKNRISHRGRALDRMRRLIRYLLSEE